MKKILYIIGSTIFAAGSGVVGYIIAKKKYEKLADKEVESVKKSLSKYYAAKPNKEESKKVDDNPVVSNKSNFEVDKLIGKDSIDFDKLKDSSKNAQEETYKKYAKKYTKQADTNKKEESPRDAILNDGAIDDDYPAPYIITPEEYLESEYDVKTLNYYLDGILADDEFNIIKNVKEYVGDKALSSFGTYEDDVVYVRNEKYQIDYEILFNEEEFSKVAPKGVITSFPGEDD